MKFVIIELDRSLTWKLPHPLSPKGEYLLKRGFAPLSYFSPSPLALHSHVVTSYGAERLAK
jgi:hypothetical protein